MALSFEAGSRLRAIGEFGFAKAALAAVVVLKAVECIGKSCFAECTNVVSAEFEEGRLLWQIQASAFSATARARVTIPRSVGVLCGVRIARGCFIRGGLEHPPDFGWKEVAARLQRARMPNHSSQLE
jgi:hypothetical protein